MSYLKTSCVALCIGLMACSDGGSSGQTATPAPSPEPSPTPTPTPTPTPSVSSVFATPQSTARFLTQATFGATVQDIDQLEGTEASDWFVTEVSKPASLSLPAVLTELEDAVPLISDGMINITNPQRQLPTELFWINAITGDDQLRQRMAYALSQILVISHQEGTALFNFPMMVAHYQDILSIHALGNYRDLLEAVTYSPAMAYYLTYFQNIKGDPDTGRMPDENYAREIMQLFTIGVVDLNADGTAVAGVGGEAIETYDNDDVTGLARVFTGLSFSGGEFAPSFADVTIEQFSSPLEAYSLFHSDLEKRFLGTVVPAGTSAQDSIAMALDTLLEHPNTAPFIARQLIQRFVASNPQPAYVARVAAAFTAGQYQLPSGVMVGEGRLGDLAATIAAVLFDDEARSAAARAADDFGKVREPVLRFTHWARAFGASTVTPNQASNQLWNTSGPNKLNQAPYKAPSVFNFYRPGYVPPSSEVGAAGLTAPEFQIVNSSSIVGYANFMTAFIAGEGGNAPALGSFVPDYTQEVALADDPAALVTHLDDLLVYGSTSEETKTVIADFLAEMPINDTSDPDDEGRTARVVLAVLMIMTSPDYVIQR